MLLQLVVHCLILISTLFQKAKKTGKKGQGRQKAAKDLGRGNSGGSGFPFVPQAGRGGAGGGVTEAKKVAIQAAAVPEVTEAKKVAIQAAAAVNVTVTITVKGNHAATLIIPMGMELAVCGVAAKVDTGTVLIRVAIQWPHPL